MNEVFDRILNIIRNPELLSKFEDRFTEDEVLSFDQAMELMSALWNEGGNLGVLPPKDPLEGIEVNIRIARILNSCLKNRQ